MRFELIIYIVVLMLGVCPIVYAWWTFLSKDQVSKDFEIDEHQAEVEKDELAAPERKHHAN